jgi:hypothetical protein
MLDQLFAKHDKRMRTKMPLLKKKMEGEKTQSFEERLANVRQTFVKYCKQYHEKPDNWIEQVRQKELGQSPRSSDSDYSAGYCGKLGKVFGPCCPKCGFPKGDPSP